MLVSGTAALSSIPGGDAMVREIDDPNTGIAWQLKHDDSHPGGPGLLVPIAATRIRNSSAEGVGLPAAVPAPRLPVIRAGDRLIVEENTAAVDLRLEAKAMAAARVGDSISIRLTLGGGMVRAKVTGPGKATLLQDRGGWQ
jgi:hypothetical protein